MRRVTRNALLLILVVVVALLALGALPGLLKSGDPYYVTAEPLNASDDGAGIASDGGNATALGVNASTAINGSALSERQYPYTTRALENGTSDPYWKGPWGLKEAFTHSPFDEIESLEGRSPAAVTESGVVVSDNGTLYAVAVGQRP